VFAIFIQTSFFFFVGGIGTLLSSGVFAVSDLQSGITWALPLGAALLAMGSLFLLLGIMHVLRDWLSLQLWPAVGYQSRCDGFFLRCYDQPSARAQRKPPDRLQ